MAVIAPWLNTRPADFGQAAEAGARLDLQRRAQEQQAQEAAMRIQAAQAEAASRAQMEHEKLQAEQAMIQQKQGIDSQAAARKFQAQQAYQQAIASGMDPSQALMMHGPAMDISPASMGVEAMRQNRPQVPLEFVKGPNGEVIGATGGSNFKFAPRAATAKAPELTQVQRLGLSSLYNRLKNVENKEVALAGMRMDGLNAERIKNQSRALRAERDAIEAEIKQYDNIGGATAPGPAPKSASSVPQVGAVINGYKFNGGDPAKESSWEKDLSEIQ